MGAMSRRKGANGEREVFKLLNVKLGRDVFRRNLLQSRIGGADNEGELVMAVEVKRGEQLKLAEWIAQARQQAKPGQLPVLAYRRNGEPWTFLCIADLDWIASLFELLEGT
jgi:Holliday junction resolvase